MLIPPGFRRHHRYALSFQHSPLCKTGSYSAQVDKAENAILLNPLFSNRAHSLWIKLKELLEKTKNSQYNCKPMSGFFAVLYALQMCEKVDLYGFDAYTSRKKSYRYHYFDNVQGFTDVHSFDLAIEVFKFIAKKGTKGGLTINV